MHILYGPHPDDMTSDRANRAINHKVTRYPYKKLPN